MSFYQRINALEIWSTISCDRPEGPHQIPVAFATHVLAVLTTRPPAIGNIIKEVSMNRMVLPVSVIYYTARHSRRPAQNNNEYSALDAVRHGRRVQGPGTHGLHENIRREKAVDSPQRLPGAPQKKGGAGFPAPPFSVGISSTCRSSSASPGQGRPLCCRGNPSPPC